MEPTINLHPPSTLVKTAGRRSWQHFGSIGVRAVMQKPKVDFYTAKITAFSKARFFLFVLNTILGEVNIFIVRTVHGEKY
jgi:hypothetical protein